MSAQIINKLIEPYHPNRPGHLLKKFSGLVVHYTGNDAPGATAEANQRYFARRFFRGPDGLIYEADGKSPFRYASAHVICDNKTVVLVIPFEEVAWACGDKKKNRPP